MGHGGMPQLASASLWAAFLLGLTGGFGHCLTMCGPFVAAASLAGGRAADEARQATADGSKQPAPPPGRGALGFQIGYHGGRLLTYALIGLLLGMLGGAGALGGLDGPFSPVALTKWLKLAGGALLLVTGTVLLVAALRGRTARLPEPTSLLADRPWFRATTSALLTRGPRWGFALGMLMGLLPCAPLLPIEIAALATGVPLYGALTMLAFGLGTVPALAGFGAASGLVGARARGSFAIATGLLVIALGAVVVWQGIGGLAV